MFSHGSFAASIASPAGPSQSRVAETAGGDVGYVGNADAFAAWRAHIIGPGTEGVDWLLAEGNEPVEIASAICARIVQLNDLQWVATGSLATPRPDAFVTPETVARRLHGLQTLGHEIKAVTDQWDKLAHVLRAPEDRARFVASLPDEHARQQFTRAFERAADRSAHLDSAIVTNRDTQHWWRTAFANGERDPSDRPGALSLDVTGGRRRHSEPERPEVMTRRQGKRRARE